MSNWKLETKILSCKEEVTRSYKVTVRISDAGQVLVKERDHYGGCIWYYVRCSY